MSCTLCVDGLKSVTGQVGWEIIPCWCPAGRAVADKQRKEKAEQIEAQRKLHSQTNK